MTVLENTNQVIPTEYTDTFKNLAGVVQSVRTYAGHSAQHERFRDGTGSRRMPTAPLAPTPYTLRVIHTRPIAGWYTAIEKGFGTHEYRGQGLLPVPGSDFRITTNDGINKVNVDLVSQAEAIALNALRTHGRELGGTWNAGVAWGERKETANLLTQAAQRVVTIATWLRAGNWRDCNRYLPIGTRKRWKELKDTPYGKWLTEGQSRLPRKVADALASGVLEFQNGWVPLVNDVYNATEALANRNSPAHWVITGKGKYEKTQTSSEVLGSDTPFYVNPRGLRVFEIKLGCEVRLDATVDDQFFHTLSNSGITNPFSTGWQLIPLSYVADYFVGIGTWLMALDAAAGMKFHSGSCSKLYDKAVSIESSDASRGQFYGQKTHFELARTVYTNFPLPIAPLSLKPKSLNLRQLTNLTAVLYALSRGLTPDLRA